jgi:hypothetical protein
MEESAPPFAAVMQRYPELHSLTHSLTHSLAHSLTSPHLTVICDNIHVNKMSNGTVMQRYPELHSLTHSLTHSRTHSLTQSITHSPHLTSSHLTVIRDNIHVNNSNGT